MGAVGDAIAEVQKALGAEAAELLPYVGRVGVPGGATRDDFGEEVAGTPTETEGVPCDCGPLKAYERMSGGAVTAGADWWVEVPVYWDGEPLVIPANATFVVEETATEPERSFEVTGPLSSSRIWTQRLAATLRG